jgi:hypothetical protein
MSLEQSEKMVLANSPFPQEKKFLVKLYAVVSRALKNFASSVLGRKAFKNVSLKERQITNLPWAPICIGPALTNLWFLKWAFNGYYIYIAQVSVILIAMKLLTSVSK